MLNAFVQLEDGAYMPETAHSTDAGADIRCMEDFTVKAHSSAVIDTGVHVQLPKGTTGLLVSKSGLNVKHDITTTGLIDEGYTGSIVAKVYNHGSTDYRFSAGDKVTQLVILPVVHARYIQQDKIQGGSRGNGGFGSTGR